MSNELRWRFGDLDVYQKYTPSSYTPEFILITTFAQRDGRDFTSESTMIQFSAAAKLADKEWRRDVAWEHVEKRCEQLRAMVAKIDAAVAARAQRTHPSAKVAFGGRSDVRRDAVMREIENLPLAVLTAPWCACKCPCGGTFEGYAGDGSECADCGRAVVLRCRVAGTNTVEVEWVRKQRTPAHPAPRRGA